MQVVISVGGSILAPGNGPDQIAAYADVVDRLADAGHSPGVVVGGGGVAREYIETGRELGANEIELDAIGIAVTRVNARLLLAAMERGPGAPPASTYEVAQRQLQRTDVAVMGGVSPGHTTDAVSAALAEYVGADLLVFATSVEGVFDTDPNVDADATKYEELRPSELVDVIVSLEMNAGSPAPVDLLAAKLIQRAGLHAIVMDGSDSERVLRAVLHDEHEGTEIVPTAE